MNVIIKIKSTELLVIGLIIMCFIDSFPYTATSLRGGKRTQMVDNRIRLKWHFSKGNMICMSQAEFCFMCVLFWICGILIS